jgi:hypothetical protein
MVGLGYLLILAGGRPGWGVSSRRGSDCICGSWHHLRGLSFSAKSTWQNRRVGLNELTRQVMRRRGNGGRSARPIPKLRLLPRKRIDKRHPHRMALNQRLFSSDAAVFFIFPRPGDHPVAEEILAQFNAVQAPGGCEIHKQRRGNRHRQGLGNVVCLFDHIEALSVGRAS